MTSCAIYLRQSIDLAEGIERQRTRCHALALAKGWDVVAEYVDNDTSASKPRGPKTAWGRLIADATAGSFDVIISVDMDRLLRSISDLVTLTSTGAKVLTVDGEIDLTTADGEFRATMLAGVARFEIRRKKERSDRAAITRTSKGVPRPGRRAFGYETDQITIRESEAYWIRYAFDQILERGASLYSVAQHLTSEGVVSSTGIPFRPVLLSRTLRNPRNAGVYIVGGVRQPVSLIQPIVTEQQQGELSALLAAKNYAKPGPKVRNNWLAGIIFCDCGAPMRFKQINYKGVGSPNYMCETKIYGRNDGAIHRSIRSHMIEDRVTWELYIVLLQADAAAYESVESLRAGALQVQLAELARERTAATAAMLVPDADLTFLTARLADNTIQREGLERELQAVRAGRQRRPAPRSGDRSVILEALTKPVIAGIGRRQRREPRGDPIEPDRVGKRRGRIIGRRTQAPILLEIGAAETTGMHRARMVERGTDEFVLARRAGRYRGGGLQTLCDDVAIEQLVEQRGLRVAQRRHGDHRWRERRRWHGSRRGRDDRRRRNLRKRRSCHQQRGRREHGPDHASLHSSIIETASHNRPVLYLVDAFARRSSPLAEPDSLSIANRGKLTVEAPD